MPYFTGIGKYGMPEDSIVMREHIIPLLREAAASDDPQFLRNMVIDGANKVTDLVGTTMILGGGTGIIVGGATMVTGAGVIPGTVSIGTGIVSMALGKALVDLL